MNYIIKDMNNRTIIIKTNEKIKNVNDKSELFKIIDKLYEKGYIDLDIKEDFEFGRLYIPREDELDFMIKHGFKVYEI